MKRTHKIVIMIMIVILIIVLSLIFVNYFVILKTKSMIISEEQAVEKNADCILILGAGIWQNKPSPMLEDRIKEGISLYEKGASKKILMSGDHTKSDYDEVNVMKEYAIEKGISSEDIFMDHAGISTYDSIYRVKEIFKAKKVIIVTQEYHLYRALYIAQSLGLEAYGVKANPREYAGQMMRDFREVLARDKDFVMCILKPKSKFLGDPILINGNGDITNDKES